MHERLNGFRDFLAQPQAEAMNLVSFLDLPETPEAFPVPNIAGVAPFAKGTPRAATPVPGQHTRTILEEHGYSAEEIAGLIARKAISAP
jgi:crotonobetainyl-CoA:carnitine CoA-transferase CaiB-like acyl-CoA transferase